MVLLCFFGRLPNGTDNFGPCGNLNPIWASRKVTIDTYRTRRALVSVRLARTVEFLEPSIVVLFSIHTRGIQDVGWQRQTHRRSGRDFVSWFGRRDLTAQTTLRTGC